MAILMTTVVFCNIPSPTYPDDKGGRIL